MKAAKLASESEPPVLKRQLDEEFAWAVEEYQTLRQESLQAQAAQHNTMQWGLAISATMVAAGAALAGRPLSESGDLPGLPLVFFGLVVPWLLFSVSLAWMSEVRRMMRAALYIRWIEDSVQQRQQNRFSQTHIDIDEYCRFENALSGLRAPVAARGRDYEGYLGSLIILAGGQAASLIVWQLLENEYRLGISEHVSYQATIFVTWAQLPLLLAAQAFVAIYRILSMTKQPKKSNKAAPKKSNQASTVTP